MKNSGLGLGVGFIIAIIGLAFLVAGPTNLPTLPVSEVQEIGVTLLVIGIIIMLIGGVVLRKRERVSG